MLKTSPETKSPTSVFQAEFINEPKHLAVVEIGSHQLCLTLRKSQLSGHCKIITAARLAIDPELSTQPIELGKRIARWLSALGLRRNLPVACILPEQEVEYETAEICNAGLAGDDYVESAIEQLLGDERNAVVHGYWMSSQPSPDRSLYLTWTRRSYAADLASSLTKAGADCVALEPLAPILARLAGDVNSNSPSLVVYLAPREATMVLADAATAVHVRSKIRLCEETPVDLIRKRFSVSQSAAETLLTDWGIGPQGDRSSIQSQVATAIQPWFDSILFELERTIRFIRLRHEVENLQDVVLCGPGAETRNLTDAIAGHLQCNVRLASLPATCSWVSAEPYTSAFGAAAALATRGVYV